MLAEDHQVFRDGLTTVLRENGINVIGAAPNGKILIDMINENLPDIVILDLRMPVMNGHEVLKVFVKQFPSIRTIVLSSDYQPFFVAGVILDGARAYLRKNSDPLEIIKAIQSVHTDGFYFNDVVSKDILEQLRSEKKLYYIIGNEKFSEREIEVLRELCSGLTDEQVADKLNISPYTVNFHKRQLFRKTECKNVALLAQYAVRQGMLDNM